MQYGINRSNKFIQSFQVDVVKRAQSDSKQQVRYFAYTQALTEATNCREDFQNFSGGTNSFVPAEDFHGHEL